MKRILLYVFFLSYSLITFAQLNGDGYYRIQNVGSHRYLYLKDDKGSINVGATTADMGAIELWMDFNRTISDPSSVLYVKNVGGKEYRFHSQGTNSYEVIGYDLKMIKNRDGSYRAYQSKSGMTSYLCDAERTNVDKGQMGTNDNGTNYRYWNFIPLTLKSNQYFGVKPTVSVAGKYYAPFYAEFPFVPESSNTKVYYVYKVKDGMAVVKEMSNGMTPGAFPVIIQCASSSIEKNKLSIGGNTAAKPSDNQLGGVYFKNMSRKHHNTTAYNPSTMRVLGKTSTGKLGFITPENLDILPANQSYLEVPAGTDKELVIVGEKEYEDFVTGIDNVVCDESENLTIYSTSGVVVGKGKADFDKLPRGIYIVNGQKKYKK